MDGELFPAWFLVLAFSAAGSCTFLVAKPYQGATLAKTICGAFGSFGAGTATGMALTFGVCEYTGLENVAYHWAVAFLIGLLGVTLCRMIVQIFESEGLAIMARAIKRILGVPDNGRHNQPNGRHDPPAPP